MPSPDTDSALAPDPRATAALDARAVAAVLAGETARFEEIILRHQPRLFATARRYARREDEVADIVQEILLKAFTKLASWRADAPFEHWLMRLAVRTCFDFLRGHQRNREQVFAELTHEEEDWLERHAGSSDAARDDEDAARTLVQKAFEALSPANRLVLTLLELEDRTVKEISSLTGWSVPLVKVRAFRARAELRKVIGTLKQDRYL
jgi:RNA polymerase sigma-70 factor, ECF subfamily